MGRNVFVVVDGQGTCTGCGTTQPIGKFKTRQDETPFAMCNRCLYVRYTRPNAQKKTELIQQYKLEQGCMDCGYSEHWAALEFDHRPGTQKRFNLGEKIGSYTLKTIWEEISKCDVVCANCHAIRTVSRRRLVGGGDALMNTETQVAQ